MRSPLGIDLASMSQMLSARMNSVADTEQACSCCNSAEIAHIDPGQQCQQRHQRKYDQSPWDIRESRPETIPATPGLAHSIVVRTWRRIMMRSL